MLEDVIDRHSATVINTGQATYQHYSGSVSHLDVAIVDNATAAVADWSVLNNTMGSGAHCPTVLVTVHNSTSYIESDGPTRFILSKSDRVNIKSSAMRLSLLIYLTTTII